MPWIPTHSLSKWTNKYTNCKQIFINFQETNMKINYENKVLLNKMMEIDKKFPMYSLTPASKK
jgi:hypothetical protein